MRPRFRGFTKTCIARGSAATSRASRTGLRKTANARRASTACCPRGSTKQRAGSAQRCRGCCAKQRTSSVRLLVADHCHGEATARYPWEVVAAREKLAAMEEWNYAGRGAGFLRDVHGRGIRPWRAPGRGRAQPWQAQGRGGRCCCCFWIEELGAGNSDAMDREVEVGHGRQRATCSSSDPEKMLCVRWSQGEGVRCSGRQPEVRCAKEGGAAAC